MSEEELAKMKNKVAGSDVEDVGAEQEIVDFEQNGLLLKIATNGIAVLDYVKRLKESDIFVAVDGEVFTDGPKKLRERFDIEAGDEPKWLLTFLAGMVNFSIF